MVFQGFSFTRVRNWCLSHLEPERGTYRQGYEMDEDVSSLWEPVLFYLVLVFKKNIREIEDDSRCTSKFVHIVNGSLNTSLTVGSVDYHSDSLHSFSMNYKLWLILWEAIINGPGTPRLGKGPRGHFPFQSPGLFLPSLFVSNGPLRAICEKQRGPIKISTSGILVLAGSNNTLPLQ
jgi:hypothetical protein